MAHGPLRDAGDWRRSSTTARSSRAGCCSPRRSGPRASPGARWWAPRSASSARPGSRRCVSCGIARGCASRRSTADVLRYLAIAAPLMFGLSLAAFDEWYDRWFGALLGDRHRRLSVVCAPADAAPGRGGGAGDRDRGAARPSSRLWSEGRRDDLAGVMQTTLQVGLGLAVLAAGGKLRLRGADRRRWSTSAAPSARPTRRRSRTLLRVFSIGVPAWVLQQIARAGLLRARRHLAADAARHRRHPRRDPRLSGAGSAPRRRGPRRGRACSRWSRTRSEPCCSRGACTARPASAASPRAARASLLIAALAARRRLARAARGRRPRRGAARPRRRRRRLRRDGARAGLRDRRRSPARRAAPAGAAPRTPRGKLGGSGDGEHLGQARPQTLDEEIRIGDRGPVGVDAELELAVVAEERDVGRRARERAEAHHRRRSWRRCSTPGRGSPARCWSPGRSPSASSR